jgi:hypothetical protein
VLHTGDPAPAVEPRLEHVGAVQERMKSPVQLSQTLVELFRSRPDTAYVVGDAGADALLTATGANVSGA